MRTITEGYRGLSLLVSLNGDRLFFPAAIAVALLAGGYLASL